jgi:hypothetical protein
LERSFTARKTISTLRIAFAEFETRLQGTAPLAKSIEREKGSMLELEKLEVNQTNPQHLSLKLWLVLFESESPPTVLRIASSLAQQ